MVDNIFFKTTYKSPVGTYILACDTKENLIGVWLKGQKYFCSEINDFIENDTLGIFIKTKKLLSDYFQGKNPSFNVLHIAPVGSDFRQLVWQELLKIPYGQTTTYGEIAQKIAKKLGKKAMSAQAIGNAVGHNPISIIIPCHRVVGKQGQPVGYVAGIDVKTKLLAIESI